MSVKNALKVEFSISEIEKAAIMGCRVHWGWDYSKEDAMGITDLLENPDAEAYMDSLNIDEMDVENYIKEVTAPHVSDEASAYSLRNFMFEYHKSPKIKIKIKLPLSEGLPYQPLDEFSLEELPDNLSSFGLDVTTYYYHYGQIFSPKFLITKTIKNTKDVTIEAIGTPVCQPWLHGGGDPPPGFSEEDYLPPDPDADTGTGGDEPDIVPGDVNFDGDVNVLDIVDIVSYILGTTFEISDLGDFNQDGFIDVLDVVAMVGQILGDPVDDDTGDDDDECIDYDDADYDDEE